MLLVWLNHYPLQFSTMVHQRRLNKNFCVLSIETLILDLEKLLSMYYAYFRSTFIFALPFEMQVELSFQCQILQNAIILRLEL